MLTPVLDNASFFQRWHQRKNGVTYHSNSTDAVVPATGDDQDFRTLSRFRGSWKRLAKVQCAFTSERRFIQRMPERGELWLTPPHSVSAENSFDYREAALEIGAVHDERRKQANGVVAGCDHEKARIPTALHHITCRLDDVDAPHVPHASHGTHTRALSRNHRQSFAKPFSILLDRCKKIRIGETAHDIISNRRHHRPPAECGPVITRLDLFSNRGGHEHGSHWKPASHW